jgi:hypothetical protein
VLAPGEIYCHNAYKGKPGAQRHLLAYAPDEDQVADVGFGCKNKSMKDSHHGQVHPPTKASQAYKL